MSEDMERKSRFIWRGDPPCTLFRGAVVAYDANRDYQMMRRRERMKQNGLTVVRAVKRNVNAIAGSDWCLDMDWENVKVSNLARILDMWVVY